VVAGAVAANFRTVAETGERAFDAGLAFAVATADLARTIGFTLGTGFAVVAITVAADRRAVDAAGLGVFEPGRAFAVAAVGEPEAAIARTATEIFAAFANRISASRWAVRRTVERALDSRIADLVSARATGTGFRPAAH